MRVTSPIGDLPFDVQRVRTSRDGVRVEGAMGAWPTRLDVSWADLATMTRRHGGKPLGTAVCIALCLKLLRR